MASRIPPPVILSARGRHTATFIFLHGLGDTGHGWAAAMNSIRPAHLKVICPTAPSIPVTLNGGMRMPAWYDILNMIHDGTDVREDMAGAEQSASFLEGLIVKEESEVPRNRIMIGGFSQGGAIAVMTTLRAKIPFAGCIALSTYIPGNMYDGETRDEKLDVPVMQCHGKLDEMVPFERGEKTSKIISNLVKEHRFHSFPFMGHEGTEEELELIQKFVDEKLPPLP